MGGNVRGKPETRAGWIRKQHAEKHFSYLAEHRDKILLGGGLRPAPGEWYCGGMWVVEVDSRDEAVVRCENDPLLQARAPKRLPPVRLGQGALPWGGRVVPNFDRRNPAGFRFLSRPDPASGGGIRGRH